jgi:hypothetical protein
VERKFTWPLLQALLHYPIMFSKALLLIEHGPAGHTYMHACIHSFSLVQIININFLERFMIAVDFLLAEEQLYLKGKQGTEIY